MRKPLPAERLRLIELTLRDPAPRTPMLIVDNCWLPKRMGSKLTPVAEIHARPGDIDEL